MLKAENEVSVEKSSNVLATTGDISNNIDQLIINVNHKRYDHEELSSIVVQLCESLEKYHKENTKLHINVGILRKHNAMLTSMVQATLEDQGNE